jgi:peptide-methionine (S)-S-oxide reductase
VKSPTLAGGCFWCLDAVFRDLRGVEQDYFNRNPYQPYCAAVIAPKVAKFRSKYLERLAR